MLKLFKNTLLNNKNLFLKQNRLIQLTSINKIKEIVIDEDKAKKTITIQGKYLDEDQLTNTKILEYPDDDHKTKCAFCKLEKIGIHVQYSDVLILRQFLREDGSVLPQKITGLCKKQQKKLHAIVKQANMAGLIMNLQPPLINGSKPSLDQEKRFQHLKWNHSFDDYEIMKRKKKYL